MGRPELNTVDYFPHILSDGKKMFFIENKYGNNGYAAWFKILEKIASTEYHYLNLNQEEELLYLSAKCRVSESLLLEIINDLSKIGALDKELWNVKIIWSQTFIDKIQQVYDRRNNNCMTLIDLRKHLISLGILKQGLLLKKDDSNTQSKGKESKVKESISDYRVFKHLKISHIEVKNLIDIGYSESQINSIIDRIENYAKNKQYTSLFLTAKNWLEREYPVDKKEENNFLSQL